MPVSPKRGEIWQVDLEPTRGAEMRKSRPVVVISSNKMGRLPLRIIVPITGWNESYTTLAWMTRVDATSSTGLIKTSAADAFQTRGVSLERFEKMLGVMPKIVLDRITATIALVIEYRI